MIDFLSKILLVVLAVSLVLLGVYKWRLDNALKENKRLEASVAVAMEAAEHNAEEVKRVLEEAEKARRILRKQRDAAAKKAADYSVRLKAAKEAPSAKMPVVDSLAPVLMGMPDR